MNNLLKVLTESQVQLHTPEPEFKLLLNAVKEARRQSNDTKQSDAFYDSLEGLLQDLRTVTMDNRDAEAFLKPVTKSEVPDYYDIISQPMDLQTMLKKVKQKQYKSKREFKDDLDLIWSNCFTYNSTENHPLRQCATRLQAKAEKLLSNITDRKERADPPIPLELCSRGSTPRLNGVNGRGPGRARPVAFTKSPSPSKQLAAVNGKQSRRDVSPSHEPTFERTAEGMAAFLRLDRELDVRLNERLVTNGVSGPTLEERLMDYTPLYSEEDFNDMFSADGGVGEKRKVNGYNDYRPRKRAKMVDSRMAADKDVVELWWDAMQSETMIANGVPVLRYDHSEETADASSSQSITDPPRTSATRQRKKRRKASSSNGAKNTLLHHMSNNINTLRRVRTTHARLTALKESSNGEEPSAPSAAMMPQLSMTLAEEPESLVDDRPWRVTGSGVEIGAENADDCLHWMGNKVLEHVGFQGASKTALDVLAGVTSDYLYNVGRTIRYLCDKYANKMTSEEIVLHTLFESGVTRIHELERYIKDDVVRYGGRLTELEKKLTAAYEEATAEEAWDDDALFRMEDEEEDSEFVMGNFADSFGEDFLGLRALGIADELGLASLTIPKKLLRGRKNSAKLGQASVEPKEPPPPFPPPPPFVPLDSTKVEDQIGLLKPYYRSRVTALAPATAVPPSAPGMSTNPPSMPPPPHPFGLPGLPQPMSGIIPGSMSAKELPPMPFTASSSFGPPTLTPPPPHPGPPQPIVLADDQATPAHTKLGPLGQVLKSAPSAAAAAKKKAAPKPKTAVAGSKDPPDGDAAPDTPMTVGTPTATASDSPRKNKGGSAGTGKKKKAANDGIPTIIMSTAF